MNEKYSVTNVASIDSGDRARITRGKLNRFGRKSPARCEVSRVKFSRVNHNVTSIHPDRDWQSTYTRVHARLMNPLVLDVFGRKARKIHDTRAKHTTTRAYTRQQTSAVAGIRLLPRFGHFMISWNSYLAQKRFCNSIATKSSTIVRILFRKFVEFSKEKVNLYNSGISILTRVGIKSPLKRSTVEQSYIRLCLWLNLDWFRTINTR